MVANSGRPDVAEDVYYFETACLTEDECDALGFAWVKYVEHRYDTYGRLICTAPPPHGPDCGHEPAVHTNRCGHVPVTTEHKSAAEEWLRAAERRGETDVRVESLVRQHDCGKCRACRDKRKRARTGQAALFGDDSELLACTQPNRGTVYFVTYATDDGRDADRECGFVVLEECGCHLCDGDNCQCADCAGQDEREGSDGA